jgi:hypothetical protein
MNEQTITPANEVSFKDFLFKNKRNRTILKLAAVAIVVQFAIFKYFYPFASYIHGDSFAYLNAAEKNLDINTYLIGYSKFLRLFSVFNRTDYVLTAFQYLFIQSSALYLIFTLSYFYNPRKVIQCILLCFIVLNPLFLHLANLISSDGLFIALSLVWFTLLLWIIHRPSTQIIIWHTVALFIAFTVRYNAMIYPAIAALAFLLSKLSWQKRTLGMGMALLLCGSFVGFTMYKYKKLTGYWQYSPFSGWQMANNAMYAYRYVDSSKRKPVLNKYQLLDNMIREYFDSTRDVKKHPEEAIKASTYYMWTPRMPLMSYRNKIYKNDSTISELKKWASMGPQYKDYGIHIIRKYPLHYLRYFIWPNANKYYAPPVEFLQVYNSGKLYVSNETKNWFGYKNNKVKLRMKNNLVWVLNFFPILSGVINAVMLFILSYYLLLKGWKNNQDLNKAIIIGGSVWLLNATFTVFASSAALRFQSFPIIVTTIFVGLLVDWMINLMPSLKDSKTISLITSKENRENELSPEALA